MKKDLVFIAIGFAAAGFLIGLTTWNHWAVMDGADRIVMVVFAAFSVCVAGSYGWAAFRK